MFRINKTVAVKATVTTLVSMAISLAAAWLIVPLLGGEPDGPGFWMSVICPLVIAWPASAFQFAQNEKIRAARDLTADMHRQIERMHRELLIAHSALQQKARIDGLTGALNRETFFGLFEGATGNARPCALLIADADHFKQINDGYGHQAGDAALRALAEAIGSCLRPQDFWGRIGGEEFAIFLDGAGDGEARAIADAIRQAAAACDLDAEGRKIPLSVSIGGIALVGPFVADSMFQEADRRLYRAKRGGRNRVVMDPEADIRQETAAA
jgi:diguanylate cyclase (GGDEF)-like protein